MVAVSDDLLQSASFGVAECPSAVADCIAGISLPSVPKGLTMPTSTSKPMPTPLYLVGSAPARSKSDRFDSSVRLISNSRDIGGDDDAVVDESGISDIVLVTGAIIDAACLGVGEFRQEGRWACVGSWAVRLVWVRCTPIGISFLPQLAYQVQWSKGIHDGLCPCSIWIILGHYDYDPIWKWLMCWFGPLVDWITSGLCLSSGIGSQPRVVTSMVLCSRINARMMYEGCRLSGYLGAPWLIWMHVSWNSIKHAVLE